MGEFSGVVWNCGGLTTPGSSPLKTNYFQKQFGTKFDVAFLVETHHKDTTAIPDEILTYQSTHHIIDSAAASDEPYSGIIGIISRNYEIVRVSHLIQGRILNVKLKHVADNSEFSITAVYLYTNNQLNKPKTENIIRLLRDVYDEDKQNIILGDFNFIDHHQDKVNGLNQTDKMVSDRWIPFLSEVDMVDPFREQNPNRRIWSFIGTGRAKNSRIDRIYVDSTAMVNISKMNYIQTPFAGHRIFTFIKKCPNEQGKSYYKMNTSILKDTKHREMIQDLADKIKNLASSDPIHKWQTFTLLVKSQSITYSKIKNRAKRRLKQKLHNEITRLEEDPSNLQKEQDQIYYDYLKRKLHEIDLTEIEGYKRRNRFLAAYEKSEPDIQFYAKQEAKKVSKDIIGQLAKEKNGEIYTDKENIMNISTQFYKDLYTPSNVNVNTQHKLLKNINKKVSAEAKVNLDSPITIKELQMAVFQMLKGKSPGLDGIPVEFYQEYWDIIKDLYFDFIRAIRTNGIPGGKNMSVIKLIYKEKGEIFLLENYRPISLINVDIKILCKALANRLKIVLPNIIHSSQTAVYGRQIDQTVHMIRDLIDIANKEDETAAFIFLDQEKAFDRVNHNFLFKVMRAFGFGEPFIQWINLLYSNASAILNINGFLSKPIPFNRGVRQGCPLSSFLYVMVIEVFALQLRVNPNIVGFQIGGEKIVSAHYMDDATIIIKQNRCFKEVIKEISQYEEASGAKVNYNKTKGLWAGSWKGRRNNPLDIQWTSKNVKNLGVYFGNDRPALKTFEDIITGINKRLNFWKHFRLSTIGKARVVEIFIASKLVYAMKFYVIPNHIEKKLRQDIFQFINHPNRTTTVAQKEMWRLKEKGGIKLVNVQMKSEVSKAKWLIDIVSNPTFKLSYDIFQHLMGVQKGGISGRDLIFLEHSYMKRQLSTVSEFYKEALTAISKLDISKGIADVDLWDNEHLFYNKYFLVKDIDKTFKVTKYFETMEIFTFGQFLEEKVKEIRNQPFNRKAVSLYSDIVISPFAKKEDTLLMNANKNTTFNEITHKLLYEAFTEKITGFHHSQIKWADKLEGAISWDDTWNTVHNFLCTNETVSEIWHQIHLNFYTQYSYNKWHKVNDVCPLCNKLPESIYHLIFHCDVVVELWEHISASLLRLHPTPIKDEEMAFGVVTKNPSTGILIRNWLTYTMRKCIAKMEREAYYSNTDIVHRTKRKIQLSIETELDQKLFAYASEGKIDKFDKFFAHNTVICRRTDEFSFNVKKLFR